MIKKTPLYDQHVALHAKMVDFAGYKMPIHYTGIIHEHLAVRNSCGLFDVSHMGEFLIYGQDAENFLQKMTINNIKSLKNGKAQYSAMCYENGNIIDDLLIYKYENKFMLVVNASNLEKDLHWLMKHKPENVTIENKSDEIGLIAIQGPQSRSILEKTFQVDLKSLSFYSFIELDNMAVARTGYTGELGFEIYADHQKTIQLWKKLLSNKNIVPCGLGCRDTLRMEMKYCLYGNDIDESTNPIEAGLGWITNINGDYFIGKDQIQKFKVESPRQLIAFEMVDRAVPRKGYLIYLAGKKVGKVTSGTQSPSLQKGIGLGYIQTGFHQPETSIAIDIRGTMKEAMIVKPPLYKNGSLFS